MESKSGSSVFWIVGGLLLAMVCCLCVVVVLGGASYLFAIDPSGSISATEIVEIGTPLPTLEPFPTFEPDDGSPTPNNTPLPAGDELRMAAAMAEQLFDLQVPIVDPVLLAEELLGVENPPRVLAENAGPISVGTRDSFWITDTDTNSNSQISAEMVYVGEHTYFWVQQGVDVNLRDVEDLIEQFENQAYPTNRAFFGEEWLPGVDGDPRLHILFAEGLGSSVAGYYASTDEYSSLVHEYSNGREMFYLSADNVSLRSDFTNGVLAHEFVHMIQWNQDRNEQTWVDEGFAELGAMLNGHDVGGSDFAYALDPDQTLSRWPSEPGTAAAHYGQAFLFLAYYLDRLGQDATIALSKHEANGLDSVDATLIELGARDESSAEPLTADDLYRDWAVAMYLQDEGVGDGRYIVGSYDNPPQAQATDSFDRCPISTIARDVGQYGVDYLRFNCSGEFNLRFAGETLTRVVPSDPHSGDYAFWSNRGDQSNMTLTRSFDLTDIDGAVDFSYWLWYDLEEDYDYLYLEISDDGGESWTIMRTPSGTDDDPSGNSYGWGYNGRSGGFSGDEWIQEQVDLSDYAGSEIQLRFQYITDAAVNGEGLLLDDLSIEAIGYEEDFESDDGGWLADGFVRLFNRVPQTYRLALITDGDVLEVQNIELSTDQRAEVVLDFDGAIDEAVLVVVGTARHSWQQAPYLVEVVAP